ncbi:MAG: hypothetical protein C0618_04295 [Desulfuromonas sp.]|nr:MAG: hypothetical protein C0618_04295 [Desulfuromonas sp.]
MAFISLLDDRAKPKGSRDPLGFELVWSYFGRQVVGNLTTITSSLEGFAVALLGFHWANELCAGTDKDSLQKAVRETFLRYEQIAAYLRFAEESKSIMGITRVAKRARDEKLSAYDIGMGADEQILSDQASYGLWGLYSAAMRDTGLVKGSERVLTDKGTAIVRLIEQSLDKQVYFQMLRARSVKKAEVERCAKAYMAAIGNPEMCQQLVTALMVGSESHALQRELWDKTCQLHKEGALPGPQGDVLNAYVNALKKTGLSGGLQQALQEVSQVERVLVALNNIFHYCRRKDGEDVETIIRNLEMQNYSYSYLPTHLPEKEFSRKETIQSALNALKEGDYKRTIQKLFELNSHVMKQRSGAPWVELESMGKLRVRVKSETAALASLDRLEQRWDYDYFLGSYLSMARTYLEGTVYG